MNMSMCTDENCLLKWETRVSEENLASVQTHSQMSEENNLWSYYT
jgi:hypothetical protein